jgi:hypothetical protein
MCACVHYPYASVCVCTPTHTCAIFHDHSLFPWRCSTECCCICHLTGPSHLWRNEVPVQKTCPPNAFTPPSSSAIFTIPYCLLAPTQFHGDFWIFFKNMLPSSSDSKRTGHHFMVHHKKRCSTHGKKNTSSRRYQKCLFTFKNPCHAYYN